MSSFTRLHFYFQCYFCGSWTYIDRAILSKECPTCHKIINFQKVKKYKYRINPTDAPRIIKYLKDRRSIIAPEFQTADKLIGGLNQK